MMASQDAPSFSEACRFWVKLGFIGFGGPTAQIAIMQTELVDRRRWIDGYHFLQARNYCMLLPGPEAMQLATHVGWLLHRVPGGLAAQVRHHSRGRRGGRSRSDLPYPVLIGKMSDEGNTRLLSRQ